MIKPPPAVLVFSLALILLCLIVIVFPYEYRDSDSSCYSSISSKLAFQPFSRWCAPQWWGHGGNQGLFREHPPGILWLPALLVRLGLKPGAAALCVNFLYLALSLFFIFKLIGRWGNKACGWGAVFGVVLTPIFLQYLIRANQEHPLALAVLAAIYGLVLSQESRRGWWLFGAALLLAVLVKGVSVLVVSLLAVLFWLVVARNKKTFVLIVLGHLAVLGAAVLFELWYRSVAHQSFWQSYFSIQGARTVAGVFHPLRKVYNVLWYAARVLGFSAPWVFFLIYGMIVSKKRKLGLFRDSFLRFVLVGSLAVILFFSLSDRKADRYIFPAYILTAMAGAVVFLETRPRVVNFLRRHERQLPLVLSALLVVLTFLRIVIHSRLYRFVRLWPQ